jgi:hypothetical protein
MQYEFDTTLANYLSFASMVYPGEALTVVAGLAMVLEAEFVREKPKWFLEPPPITRCQEAFVSVVVTVQDVSVAPNALLTPFYDAVFDACTLPYAEEPKVYQFPG